MAALLAVGLAVAALMTAGPVHAQQTPIVPDLSGTQFDFRCWNNQGSVIGRGVLAILGVDVYTGNFTGFLEAPDARRGAVTGQYVPNSVEYYLTFTVSSPTDLWTYKARLTKYVDGWYAGGEAGGEWFH